MAVLLREEKLSLYSTATQNFRIGALRWPRPQTPDWQNFALGKPTCWYLKTRNIALPKKAKPKI